VIGDEYEPDFQEKYILIIKKVYFLTRLLYSLSPASRDDSSQIEKAKSLIRNLKGLREEIKNWLEPVVSSKKEESEKVKSNIAEAKYRRYRDATHRLYRMIDSVDQNIKKL
jgi:gas vesicle protein